MLNILKHKILYADMVGRIDAHHHAKFSRNWSIQIRHMAIFQILKMPAAPAILDF